MGGRGSSSGGTGGGATGGLNGGNIRGTTSLVSERESDPRAVDDVLNVARDVRNQYGVTVEELQVADIGGRQGQSVMAYYDIGGNLAINRTYFNSAKMDKAYDECVKSGWHPSRGSKSGLEATAAHEMGHRLTDVAGQKAGNGTWSLDKTSNSIVAEAKTRMGAKSVNDVRNGISGYGKASNAEAIAEAFSDVYCNGNKASRASKAVVGVLDEWLRR